MASTSALLIFGDTMRSPSLRNEVCIDVTDPFAYIESEQGVTLLTDVLDASKIADVRPEADIVDWNELGAQHLLASGTHLEQIRWLLTSQHLAELGATSVVVPPDMAVAVADAVRERGIEVCVDVGEFRRRRRVKSNVQLEGMRRAQRAANAAMHIAADLLRRSTISPTGHLDVDGDSLTSEVVRAAMLQRCASAGVDAPSNTMVACGAAGASGHDPGSGPLLEGAPIIIDIWPRDRATGCHADFARTFVVGEIPEIVGRMHGVVEEALIAAKAAIKPGKTGAELYEVAAGPIERAGWRTQRNLDPAHPHNGFFHALGHGIGLDVHESPSVGRFGAEPFVAGDVVAIEPGVYDEAIGGVRLEDIVLVTDASAEALVPPFATSLRP